MYDQTTAFELSLPARLGAASEAYHGDVGGKVGIVMERGGGGCSETTCLRLLSLIGYRFVGAVNVSVCKMGGQWICYTKSVQRCGRSHRVCVMS